MKLGVEVFLEKHTNQYKNKRIGLLTNITGVNHQLKTTIDLFDQAENLQVTALFGPEHGIRGEAKEGEWVDSTIDSITKIPIYSLYGAEKEPNAEMLDNIDVIVCDLQDIGSRYYTFIYTMANIMKLCGKCGKQFVVLDRPNPVNGQTVNGNLVKSGYHSFVGQFSIPVRHGMTIGELALLFKNEFHISCELTVVPMSGWSRDMYFDETDLFWVPPSPNATGVDMCVLYPGTCLIEGTNLSEGRGTTKPFEMIGAPFVNGHQLAQEFNQQSMDGVIARPVVYRPFYQKYKEELCEGIQLHVSDRADLDSFAVGVKMLALLYKMYPDLMKFIKSEDFGGAYFLDLLAGTAELRNQLISGNITAYLEEAEEDSYQFHKIKKPYLLY